MKVRISNIGEGTASILKEVTHEEYGFLAEIISDLNTARDGNANAPILEMKIEKNLI